MKNQNEEIDEMIKAVLSKEEATFYDNLHEQNLFEMVGGLFSGKLKWLGVINVTFTLVFTIIGFYCLVQFMEVEATNDLIRWGVGLMACMMATSMMKIWNWNQMDKNAILREIKRLQLLIANKH
ncbi:MAG: DUF6768 family protein [Reichenbachiella sp.]|uniref:DUF6768 family protein n=1 Tax=Reichenbachiella sp. TaxID=2184521 RepID=UPI0032641258